MKDTYELYDELHTLIEQLIVDTNDMRRELEVANITRCEELPELMTNISDNIKLNNDLSIKKLDLQRNCAKGYISYDQYLSETLRITKMQLKLVEIVRYSIKQLNEMWGD